MNSDNMDTSNNNPELYLAKLEWELADKDFGRPDQRTKLHQAKIKKLIEFMTQCTPEEIGSADWRKKVNAVAIIVNERKIPDLIRDTDSFLGPLLKHNKLTTLVHDMVLVALWRDEIFPQLWTRSSERDEAGETTRFARSTSFIAFVHEDYCGKIIAAVTQRPEVAQSLGKDVFDLIDHTVEGIQHYIKRKPEKNPDLDPEYCDSDPGLSCSQLTIVTLHTMTFICNLLEEDILKTLSHEVFMKLMHPDTRLVVTLADLILTKPFCYCREKLHDHGFNKSLNKEFHPLESAAWLLLDTIFVQDKDKFCTALQMTQECYDKLLLLREPLRKSRYAMKMPEISKFRVFLDKLASKPNEPPPTWPPPPSSPYYANIRTEIEKKKDAIIAIHLAMGTFENESEPAAFRRKTWDYSAISSVYDFSRCCFNCGKPDAELRCSGCQYAYYCNRKCHSKDWWKHKSICSRE